MTHSINFANETTKKKLNEFYVFFTQPLLLSWNIFFFVDSLLLYYLWKSFRYMLSVIQDQRTPSLFFVPLSIIYQFEIGKLHSLPFRLNQMQPTERRKKKEEEKRWNNFDSKEYWWFDFVDTHCNGLNEVIYLTLRSIYTTYHTIHKKKISSMHKHKRRIIYLVWGQCSMSSWSHIGPFKPTIRNHFPFIWIIFNKIHIFFSFFFLLYSCSALYLGYIFFSFCSIQFLPSSILFLSFFFRSKYVWEFFFFCTHNVTFHLGFQSHFLVGCLHSLSLPVKFCVYAFHGWCVCVYGHSIFPFG